MTSRRIRFLALAAATMVTGLFVHFQGVALGSAARDVLGDALWAAMIVWLAGAVAPAARVVPRSISAYAVCVAVEFSQLDHAPALDTLRATRIGSLVLGSGFDARDLAAYAGGVVAAALLEWLLADSLRTKRSRSRV